MKKYNVDEMIENGSCRYIKANCLQCPFLTEWHEKYKNYCKARIYCEEKNINFNNYYEASKYYIKHLKERKLLLQDIMEL